MGEQTFDNRMLKFRICWFISCLCSELCMWSWPGQFWKLLYLILCGRNNIMTLVGLHTVYSAEYENKYFPGPKHVCVQFSLCKMDMIKFFFPSALFYLSINFWIGKLSFVYVCTSVAKQKTDIIFSLRYNSDINNYKCWGKCYFR